MILKPSTLMPRDCNEYEILPGSTKEDTEITVLIHWVNFHDKIS